jgi:hypothetical protein
MTAGGPALDADDEDDEDDAAPWLYEAGEKVLGSGYRNGRT